MKTFAPLIIFFVLVGVITVGFMLYEGRWRAKRAREDSSEERRHARSKFTRGGEANPVGEVESLP